MKHMKETREASLERHWEEPQGLHWKPGVHCLHTMTLTHGSHNQIYTIFSVLLLNTIMLNLGISLMVQDLGVCPPMRGHRFDPWSRKIPHAMGQLNPCCTTTEASTLECMLIIKRSQHNGKPKLCSSKEPAQSKRRKTSKKKVTLNLDAFLNHVAHIP